MAPDGCEGVTTNSRQLWLCAGVVVVAAVVCLSGCSLSRTTSLGADRDDGRHSSRAAAARLNIASFYFDSEVDKIYVREMNRIQALCDTDNFQCLSTNVKPIAHRVVDVHSAPDSSSSVVAHVDGVFEPHDGYIINIRLEFQEAGRTAGSVTWLESVGDWHYGIEVRSARRETHAGVSSMTNASPGPVLNRQLFEPREIFGICCDEDEPIGVSDRRDLAVHEWGWTPEGLEAGTLLAVPRCRRFVVRQHRKGCTDDVTEIAFERGASLALGQSATTIG